VCTVRESDGAGSPGDFFHGDDVRQVAHVAAAELCVGRDAEKPHVTLKKYGTDLMLKRIQENARIVIE